MTTLAQMFDLAQKHHQTGNLQHAEQLYRQILQTDPQNVDAHYNLGKVLKDQGKLEEAAANYQEALRLKPDHAVAHYNLGNVHAELGKLDEAIAGYQQALRLKPDFFQAHNNLGNIFKDQGKLDEAAASYQNVLRFKPDYIPAHYNLGNVRAGLCKLDEAITSYQQAVRLKPDFFQAHNNLGVIFKNQGKLAEAISSYRQALQHRPNFVEAHNNLGFALQKQGKLAEAVACYRQALRFQPDLAEAHNNLGLALQELGNLEEAVGCYRQALHLQPDRAEAHNNLGNTFREKDQLDEAVTSFREALRLQPHLAETYNNLGNVFRDSGRHEDALAGYREALRLQPSLAHVHSNLVFLLNYHPGYDASAIQEECRRWNQQHAEPLTKIILPHANLPDPERRLRIGYVSPGFRDHVDSFFIVPLLASHDHRQFEIFCYADVACQDNVTERLRGYADVWRCTVGLSDQQIADSVRGDQIDILIDLKLHTANNRLLLFARKPAPVQVAWLGYPGTTGLSTIDYRLTDPYLDPPGLFDAYSSEELIRLPDTFWCYDPRTDQPPVSDLPAMQHGHITFGCLNNFGKVNDGCLMLWAKVLQAVPRSCLLLRTPRGQARDHVLAKLQQEEIAPARVELVDQQTRLDYLKLHHRIDIALDPLPYNGHTTSLDAFWMGVPVLTLVGKTVVGRAGLSQLCNLGLKELAAETEEQYVALAVQLAADLPRLQELRSTLRQRMLRSPLMDGKRFALHVEQAYRQMWQRWCRQKK